MDAMSDVSNVAVMRGERGREREEKREGKGGGGGRERDDHERGDIPIASMCRS